ncbi:hypothetical protein [Nannocystis pusilla]|uniref:hypothetical protein n=1 Tax=Nannocystis pusilla TaxID=889268 RepID=UPI003DA24DA3
MPSKFAGSGLMIALLMGCAEGTISDTGSIPLPTTHNITTAHPNSSVSDSDGSSGDGGSGSESETGDEPTFELAGVQRPDHHGDQRARGGVRRRQRRRRRGVRRRVAGR